MVPALDDGCGKGSFTTTLANSTGPLFVSAVAASRCFSFDPHHVNVLGFHPRRAANAPAASPLARHFETRRAHSTDVAIQGTSVRLFYPQGTKASRRGTPSGYESSHDL
jgi:hypothetical protein